jgi:hypothetical protein
MQIHLGPQIGGDYIALLIRNLVIRFKVLLTIRLPKEPIHKCRCHDVPLQPSLACHHITIGHFVITER